MKTVLLELSLSDFSVFALKGIHERQLRHYFDTFLPRLATFFLLSKQKLTSKQELTYLRTNYFKLNPNCFYFSPIETSRVKFWLSLRMFKVWSTSHETDKFRRDSKIYFVKKECDQCHGSFIFVTMMRSVLKVLVCSH